MTLELLFAIVALIGSFMSIGSLVFGAGRAIEALDNLKLTLSDLRKVIKEATLDLREMERFASRVDEKLDNHDMRITRLEE